MLGKVVSGLTLLVLVCVFAGHSVADSICRELKVVAEEPGIGAAFGDGVCVFGGTAIVGSEFHSHDGVTTGGAFLYERSSLEWSLLRELRPDEGVLGGRFGHSVFVHGSFVMVGAPDEACGVVYVFERDLGGPNNWGLLQKLVGQGGGYGHAIGVSGNVAVIGAPNDAVGGALWVYEYDETGLWCEAAILTASDATSGALLGTDAGVHGPVVVGGARGADASAGRAYVFEMPADGWCDETETQVLVADDGAVGHGFGIRVAIDEGRIAIGATHDNHGAPSAGSAYVFERDGVGCWVQVDKLVADDPSNDANFGYVTMSGETIAVGAPRGAIGGKLYLFQPAEDGGFELVQSATGSDTAAGDEFGQSVFIDQQTVVVGARSHGDEGAAYIFGLNCASCVRSHGFWKTHPEEWPVEGLTLGAVFYEQNQLIAILKERVAGNGLISLAKQLIAARLNQHAGAPVPAAVEAAMDSADETIGSFVVPPVGSGRLSPATTTDLRDVLDDYNTGSAEDGPAECE